VVTEIANSAQTTLSADQVTNFKVKIGIVPKSYQDLTNGKAVNYSPFRPGMTATVDVITNKKNKVIGVPISAIVIKTDTSSVQKLDVKKKKSLNDEKFECVFVKVGEKAKLRVITTGIQDDSNIEITSGLSEGDLVITGPYSTVTKTLKNGDKVEEKTEDEEA
jgi:HlyD family secretion protein